LVNLKLIKVSDTKVLLILVADNEVVKNTILPFSGTSQEVLDMISKSLIDNLYGSTIEDIDVKKISRLKFDLRQFENVIDYLVPILRDTLSDINDMEYQVEGLDNVLSMPEFSNRDKAKRMYKVFDNPDIINELFNNIDGEGIFIKIGEENEVDEFKECSIITTTYHYRTDDFGKIAIIGPKRMDYQGIITVIENVKNTLSDIFSGINL